MNLAVQADRLRAIIDATVAILGSVGIGSFLVNQHHQANIVNLLAIGAGLILVTTAAVSIMRREPAFSTPADRVTLIRVVLVGGCATIVVLSLFGTAPVRSWWLIAIASPALLLDVVDGWVARKTGTANEHGARLDMEIDAAFLMVLSVAAAFVVGPWVLTIGAMRYLFVAASWWRPALRQQLRPSTFRRVTAGIQGVALVVALAPIVPFTLATAVAALALALLLLSFGKDIVSLERRASS